MVYGDGVRARFPESGKQKKKKKTDLRDRHNNKQALDGVLSKEINIMMTFNSLDN
jgi:hypothetical protein